MSNQACLFAEDTPTPYDPFTEEDDPLANTVRIAAAAYQVPAFWLFCFDKDSLVEIESEEGNIPGLVGEMSTAQALLSARDRLVSAVFPAHVTVWDQFRRAVDAAAGRKYLKVDTYDIWMINADDKRSGFGLLLQKALGWFESEQETDFVALLSLAGIEGYDPGTRSFLVGQGECPERFLYGWLEE